jgi:transposase-like protein
MSEFSLFGMLGQVSGSEAGEVFRGFVRGHVRELVCRVMAEEVDLLCGPKHQPTGGDSFRSGNSPGRIQINGKREEIIRPRVRRRRSGGGSQEVLLQSYQSASDPGELEASILAALKAGVSTREVAGVAGETHGTSRSNASRLWQDVGHQFVDELRGRDLSQTDWLILMLDGLVLSSDQTAVVAIGIDCEGRKQVLDFELGSSENKEVCLDLLRRVTARGFACKRRLFAVLDGSDALKNSLLAFFPDVVIQRCLVHKERNIRAKLSKRHWGELARLFKRLREVQGAEAALEVVRELERFLKDKSATAYNSLLEAGDDLTALHQLNVPSTLHRSLLSTNAIESSFRNTRRKLGRVTRFRPETDQASRWMAFSLLEVNKGFRRIAGHYDLGSLMKALERPSEPAEVASATMTG